jgi:hypothetical protein
LGRRSIQSTVRTMAGLTIVAAASLHSRLSERPF